MKFFILIFFETLLFFNSEESPVTSSNIINRNGQSYDVQGLSQGNHHEFTYNQNLSSFDKKRTIIRLSSSINIDNQLVIPTARSIGSRQVPESFTHTNGGTVNTSKPVAATLELPGSQHFSNTSIKENVVPISLNGDRIIFPDDDASVRTYNLTKEEIDCFTENKVFFKGTCEELLQKGPCNEEEWLVLDLISANNVPLKIKPMCVKKFCNSTSVFWYKTNSCYLNNDDNTDLCPSGKKLQNDFFGYGECVCKSLHYNYHESEECYKLFTQGPCSEGYLFVEKSDRISCMKNPCHNSSLVPYNDRCYEYGKQGPCEPNSSLKYSLDSKKLECVDDLKLLAAIGASYCPKGGCPTPIKVEDSKKYFERIIASANKRKG